MNCCTSDTPSETLIDVANALSADSENAPAPQENPRYGCTNCRRASRPVTRKTMLLMLKPELFDRIGSGPYRFCSDPECRVVYFTEGKGECFTTADLRLRVGIKEKEDPIPLCYCFGFDEADLREEISKAGRTFIPQRITALLKDGLCACSTRNPSGTCCLGEVTKTVKRLSATRRMDAS
jgi:hypothetical protein